VTTVSDSSCFRSLRLGDFPLDDIDCVAATASSVNATTKDGRILVIDIAVATTIAYRRLWRRISAGHRLFRRCDDIAVVFLIAFMTPSISLQSLTRSIRPTSDRLVHQRTMTPLFVYAMF
jgi:hypothetical protein